MLQKIKTWLTERNLEYTISESAGNLAVVLPIYLKDRLDALVQELNEEKRVCRKAVVGNTVQLVLSGEPQDTLAVRLKSVFESNSTMSVRLKNTPFTRLLSERLESLDGIAADFQPGDVISTLTKAIQQLGLHNKFGKLGIKMLVTKDKQYITFVREVEGQRVRLLQCATQSLVEPKELESILTDLLDIAEGHAPGASQLKLDRLKQISAQISDIARRHAMAGQRQEPNEMLPV